MGLVLGLAWEGLERAELSLDHDWEEAGGEALVGGPGPSLLSSWVSSGLYSSDGFLVMLTLPVQGPFSEICDI